jgi:hypothetical protein
LIGVHVRVNGAAPRNGEEIGSESCKTGLPIKFKISVFDFVGPTVSPLLSHMGEIVVDA